MPHYIHHDNNYYYHHQNLQDYFKSGPIGTSFSENINVIRRRFASWFPIGCDKLRAKETYIEQTSRHRWRQRKKYDKAPFLAKNHTPKTTQQNEITRTENTETTKKERNKQEQNQNKLQAHYSTLTVLLSLQGDSFTFSVNVFCLLCLNAQPWQCTWNRNCGCQLNGHM